VLLLSLAVGCTKQEDMVRVNTDIVEAIRTWSVYMRTRKMRFQRM
jgi:hypothetical protein